MKDVNKLSCGSLFQHLKISSNTKLAVQSLFCCLNKLLLGLPILSLFFLIPIAYADVTIKTAVDSGAPGCESTADGCYLPNLVIVNPNEKITFVNTDTAAAHTYTSGTPDSGAYGAFDSGLVMAGNEFSVTLDRKGTYDYFCMVHPWMIGTIMVGIDGIPDDRPNPPPNNDNDDDNRINDLIMENNELKDQITDLKLENHQLKNEIDSLKDQIVTMTSEFVEMISQLNEWFRSEVNNS